MKFKKIDYERHFWVGFIISFLTFFVCDFFFELGHTISVSCSFIIPVAAGFFKELYDKLIKKTAFTNRDFWNTVLGGAIMSGIFALITLIIPAFLN